MPNFKAEFVKRVLIDEGKRYHKNQSIEMEKRLHFHTSRLFNDRSEHVSADNTMDGELTIRHTAYQRFLDIKKTIRNKKTNRAAPRSYRIHNRFVYGHYFGIANRLMFELTDDAKDAIIKDFNAFNNG